ncbi:MAG: ABC-F family ATP-binding cassette domain-containing protein, partial [Proteobacteria bacterium]|nr:ABC-F family ATP-binding cassette domain-containing protein [Pseudomonadota bacterium]
MYSGPMVTVTDLGMYYGGQTLFDGVNLHLEEGNRYGIVGANGSGKSTLLRLLSGQEESTDGEVLWPRHVQIGVLEQDHFQYDHTPIIHVVMMGNSQLWDAIVAKEALLEEDVFDDQRYTQLEDIVNRYNGYTLESRAGKILEGLGIPTEVHNEPLSVLSGGFKLRVLLAKTLASEPDFLLLDEPTNHLDILAIRWLEQFLMMFAGCAVVVSHDLRFLDSVCTHILDVDYEKVICYRGGYRAFGRQKAEERVRLEGEIERRVKEIAHHKAFITRFKAKATKARQANSRQKRLDKIELKELPRSSRRYPKFKFVVSHRSGKAVLKVSNISKAYGDNLVLDNVSFEVRQHDRIAVIGANGIGKSTLLKILVDALQADAGLVEWGYKADFGYFPQNHLEALGDLNQSVKSCLWDVCPAEG